MSLLHLWRSKKLKIVSNINLRSLLLVSIECGSFSYVVNSLAVKKTKRKKKIVIIKVKTKETAVGKSLQTFVSFYGSLFKGTDIVLL